VTCDVAAFERMDLALIDQLARLALECHRAGRDLRLIGPNPALRELVELVGLDGVLTLEPRG
jgi:anti-anti-sigma regulatory factor